MADVLSYHQIEERMRLTVRKLDSLVAEIAEAGFQAATAEAAWQLKFASERVTFRAECDKVGKKVTADQTTDWATVNSSDELEAHLLAKNHLTVLRSSLSATQEILSALRTLAASHRAATT